MAELSKADKRAIARGVRSQTWALAGARLQTLPGLLATAIFLGLLTWAGVFLAKSDATPDAADGEDVIQPTIAVVSVLLLPFGLWLWLSISAWKRKAFALQFELNELAAHNHKELVKTVRKMLTAAVAEISPQVTVALQSLSPHVVFRIARLGSLVFFGLRGPSRKTTGEAISKWSPRYKDGRLDIPAFLDSAGEVTSAIAAIKLEDVNADVLAVDDTWDTWVSPGPVPRQQNRSEAAPLKSVLHEGVQREADLNAELQNRHWQADRAIDSLNGREICGIGCRVLFIRAFMLESRLPEPFALPEIEMYCFGTVGTATECAEKLRDAFDEFGLIELTGPPPTTRHAAIRLQDPKWFQWWKKRSLIIDVIARIKEREAMPPGPLKLEHYDAGLYAGADPSTQK